MSLNYKYLPIINPQVDCIVFQSVDCETPNPTFIDGFSLFCPDNNGLWGRDNHGHINRLGITGVTGNQGRKGVTGNQGRKGVTGNQGIIGNIGIQGLQGITGEKGPTGRTGITGITGEIGPTGPLSNLIDVTVYITIVTTIQTFTFSHNIYGPQNITQNWNYNFGTFYPSGRIKTSGSFPIDYWGSTNKTISMGGGASQMAIYEDSSSIPPPQCAFEFDGNTIASPWPSQSGLVNWHAAWYNPPIQRCYGGASFDITSATYVLVNNL